MTNEQFLHTSYFVAAAAGVSMSIATALILARPHRLATARAVLTKLGTILRRAFPTWLVLAVLLGFMAVSYFDCSHPPYLYRDRGRSSTPRQYDSRAGINNVLVSSHCTFRLWLRTNALSLGTRKTREP